MKGVRKEGERMQLVFGRDVKPHVWGAQRWAMEAARMRLREARIGKRMHGSPKGPNTKHGRVPK